MRRERERKAGNAHHPTQDQGQAGRRFAQQEESIPPEPKLPPKQSQSAKPSARCRPHISKKVYVRCQPEQAQVEGRPSNRQELCSSGQFVVGQSRQGASTESAIWLQQDNCCVSTISSTAPLFNYPRSTALLLKSQARTQTTIYAQHIQSIFVGEISAVWTRILCSVRRPRPDAVRRQASGMKALV